MTAVAPASDGAHRRSDPVDQTWTNIRSRRGLAMSALLTISLRSRGWPGARIDHNFADVLLQAGWLR